MNDSVNVRVSARGTWTSSAVVSMPRTEFERLNTMLDSGSELERGQAMYDIEWAYIDDTDVNVDEISEIEEFHIVEFT